MPGKFLGSLSKNFSSVKSVSIYHQILVRENEKPSRLFFSELVIQIKERNKNKYRRDLRRVEKFKFLL